jgi:predicted alpha-1,6-mannanase (GH76 family)
MKERAISDPASVRHPYYDTTLLDALKLARLIEALPGQVKDTEPLPDVQEAFATIKAEAKTCGFNWITGRVAMELLRYALGEENPFSP